MMLRRHLSLLRLTLKKPNVTRSRLLSAAASSTTKSSPSPTPSPSFSPSPNVNAIVDEVSKLTLLELSSLTHLLVPRLNLPHLPTLAVIPAGMSFSGAGAAAASPAAGENAEEEKKEKTAFDVKLEGFDASAKIKVIKEVRGFTDLGLKEAKELVEKAPVVVKGGVSKEEAEKILEKLKAIGAKVALE